MIDYRKKATAVQFVKYALVGVLNTLVTLSVIFVCKSVIGINPLVSNAIGYVLGVINSFLWNKTWVFRSHDSYLREAAIFLVGFLICYGLQFLTVWVLSYKSPLNDFEWNIIGFVLSGYGLATLVGNLVYTIANYIYNKLVTFRRGSL
ncbi:MAG: GtrA family protein [Pseudoflavonifractor sp.]|nr:GtrA family protein [Pseudoflavonifractor sp.]